MRPNRVREVWAAGKAAANCWISLPGTLAAEMLAHQGWDSLTVDLQHGHSDFTAMCAMFAAISTTDTTPLMRIAYNNVGDVTRALDAGAYGVICPNIDTAEQCTQFIDACRYPPLGKRSFGPKRAVLYGGPDYVHHANDTVLAIVQIESREAMANLDAISSVPGLDMLYVGPTDLGFSLGTGPIPNPTDPVMIAALDDILAAAKRAGIRAGMHCTNADYALTMIAKGFDFVTVISDADLLSSGKAVRARIP